MQTRMQQSKLKTTNLTGRGETEKKEKEKKEGAGSDLTFCVTPRTILMMCNDNC